MGASVVSWLLIVAVWLLTACTTMPQQPLSGSTNQAKHSFPITVGTGESDARLEFKIAQILNLKEDSVTIRNVELVNWPDSCLGLPQPDELCAQVITPGFNAIAETPKGKYILNGDREQHNFRLMQTIETP